MFLREAGIRAIAGLLVLFPLACRDSADTTQLVETKLSPKAPPADGGLSPDGRIETYETLRADLELVRDPSDGGGRAWLEAPDAPVRAGDTARIEIVYEAGPLGVAEGGAVFLQVSPFWGWDTPQVRFVEGPGYTEVSTEVEGLELRPRTLGPQLLEIALRGVGLAPGERIRIVFGAGPAGARVDRFAEHRARLWIQVDGNGDGIRALMPDPPFLDVVAGRPAQLLLVLPTALRPGDPVPVVVAVLDANGNAGMPVEGSVILDPEAAKKLGLPGKIVFGSDGAATKRIEGLARSQGVYRLRGRGTGELAGIEAESNPLLVREGVSRLLWGDLHGHSQLSDGTGTLDDYFGYARDVAALDVVALTDHDHWGMQFLDAHPELWSEIRAATRRFHEPGRFVTLLGYEWTSWLQGHRHVLYFGDEGELLSSMDPNFDQPDELWAALRGKPALTFAHHSAGGPVATNWNFAPDPELEPVTEVASVHGSSEAEDSPGRIDNAVPGNFVRDALGRGFRLGFIGSGDSHDGHPGLERRAFPGRQGGLAAILAESRTREAVLGALRERRVYATNGPRIWLETRLGGRRPGSVAPAEPGPEELSLEVLAPAPIERVDVIRGRRGETGGVSVTLAGQGRRELRASFEIDGLEAGEYLYLRIVQQDGGLAWSSPFYASG
ncbi:MAG: CehA/McbA family metallohydrolase [Myxococcales bacterium]|nr:CehA/McbA family metallohydrolase [Myxococcales bacterium]